MTTLFKIATNNYIKSVFNQAQRNISITSTLHLKKINEIQEGKDLVIYGEIVSSEREPYLLKSNHSKACPLCATGLDIKHTDVLILSQFVRKDGCMLPRRITGLCKTQQKRVTYLVAMAQKSGLMPNLTPAYSNKDPKKRYEWKKYNKYFDETTIPFKL
ncbi:unnamed protein product [Acanthoscelides obtectus]|uniref:Ribosomal protein S18 n=1 Tax=Acanthoscelides obtectus TaxID=200917 RepID=A0A9P0LY33_ACAOB|nr:unnamed protein product [Acanthoscelides obtectus]CAK1677925.1 28S ribosomal protein S18a, mitochondrial [Acanthoscelides obtectus]